MRGAGLHKLSPLAALLGAGCLDAVPAEQPAPMCVTDEDCSSGEICEPADGICYGDPPRDLAFAAVLQPPVDSGDGPLVETEIPELTIDADGTVSGLRFDEQVTIQAHISLACEGEIAGTFCTEDVPIEATVTIARPSSFPGGPGFRRKLTATVGGESSLTLHLPRSYCAAPDLSGEEGCSDGYDVLVTPGSSDLSADADAPSAEELAPPARFRLVADAAGSVSWRLGDPDALKEVEGCLKNSAGEGISGVEVVAEGKWTPLGELERSSNEGVTETDGCFKLRVPRTMTEFFDVVFKPGSETELQPLPSLRLKGIQIPLAEIGAYQLGEVIMPDVPIGREVSVRVMGVRGNGERVDVPGAKVVFNTQLEPHPETRDGAEVLFAAQGETDAQGRASLDVPAMDAAYSTVVVPPSGSEFGAVYDLTVEVSGTASGVIGEIELPLRLAVQGKVQGADGLPISGGVVTAKPSPELTWSLDASAQHALTGVPDPGATTGAEGRFFLWLDGSFHEAPAGYDFFVEPPPSVDAPRWSFDAVEASTGNVLDLGVLKLPQTAWSRGRITDAAGEPVAGAQVRLYQLRDAAYCDQECEAPAYPRGTFTSDESGMVKIPLPDPPPASNR